MDLGAKDAHGRLVIDDGARIRLAGPGANGGERVLRRGDSFTDGTDPATGSLDAGLFSICFNRDPHGQFVQIQRRLDADDLMNEHVKHTGSVLRRPPGVCRVGDRFGRALFE